MKNPALRALNVWVDQSAQTLAALLAQEVMTETPPEPKSITPQEWDEYLGKCFSLAINLSGSIAGPMLLALEDEDACSLGALMLGEEEPPTELSKLHQEVVSEAIQQIVAMLPDSLASSIQLPGTSVTVGSSNYGPPADLGAQLYQGFQFPLTSGGHTYVLHLLIPSMLAEELSNSAFLFQQSNPQPAPSRASSSEPQQPSFQSLSGQAMVGPENDIELILDVPMQVTAVLGTTSISMEELIALGKGSVLELDKLAGEPVELYVHGCQVAIGEVVVIDERFGIKILQMSNGRAAKRGVKLSMPA